MFREFGGGSQLEICRKMIIRWS